MERYFRCEDQVSGETQVTYLEVDGEEVSRQIKRYRDQWSYASEEISPLNLTDQPFSNLRIKAEEEITREEFEEAWRRATTMGKLD